MHSIDHLQADIGITVKTLPPTLLVTHSSVSLSMPECVLLCAVNRTMINNNAPPLQKMLPLSLFPSCIPTNENNEK